MPGYAAAATRRERHRPRPGPALPAPYPPPGAVFPANILGTKVELLINGTWTDITTFVLQRDKMVIRRGRQDESGTMTPSTLALTLQNTDGRFSPRNTTGAYYPYLGRNTQIRVSINTTSTTGVQYSGYRFWGEVSAWPPRWDTSGTDVYVPITASGVMRRFQQNATIGSAIRRYISLLTGSLIPVAYWPMEEASGASQFGNLITPGNSLTWTGTPTLASDTGFNGSDPMPLVSLAVLTGSTGSFSSGGGATYTTPGTYQYIPANSTLTSVECWGAGAGGGGSFWGTDFGAARGITVGCGGGGGYAKAVNVPVTPGAICTVVVGLGGAGGHDGGPNTGHPGTSPNDGGPSSFITDSGASVNGYGGQSFTGFGGLYNGTGITLSAFFQGGQGAGSNTDSARGAGQAIGGDGGASGAGTAAGGSAETGSSGTSGAAPAAPPAGGGSGGQGGNAANPGGTGNNGTVPGGAGGGAGSPLNAGGGPGTGGNGAAGKVVIVEGSSSAPTTVITRCLLHVPSSGATNNAVILKTLISSGTLDHVELYYQTSGNGQIGFRGLDSGSVVKFDTSGGIVNVNGAPMLVSMELTQSGSLIVVNLKVQPPGGLSSGVNAASFTGTLGAASQVVVNPAGTVNDTGIGHIHVQYALDPIENLAQAINGFNSETAGARFTRLCKEARIASVFNGSVSDTPAMGPQLNRKLSDLLQEIEDADRGQLYEPRETFGLGYSTRKFLMNQVSTLDVDYTNAHLAGVLEPATDDQLVRNDITVSRNNGASVNTTLTSGALSTLDPPNGVGDYSYSLTANVNSDTQIGNLAQWILQIGTVDEYRYPTVTFNQARAEVAGLIGQIAILDVGKFFRIFQPPAWLPSGTIRQLAFGFTETINAFEWTIDVNAVPESPYEGAGLSW